MPRSNRFRSRALFAAVLLLGVFAIVEAIAWQTSSLLARRGVLYAPQGLDDYEAYLKRRDPVLGWPSPGSKSLDATGARTAPDAGEPNCAEVYGDSFTYGSHVANDETYAHTLSGSFGCRVGNFGIEGYGSDQALMRYIDRGSAEASVIVLAHLTENVMRNVNQFRGLLYSTGTDGFKPRFALGPRGELVRIPIPEIAPEHYASFVAAPEDFLEHEYFAPGGASGTTTRGFPHILSVLRGFGHFHVRTQLRGETWYSGFYQPDHPSNGLQVTTAIFREFNRVALSRGQTPLVAIIGTELDFLEPEERTLRGAERPWSHQPLIDALERENIAYVNTPSAFERAMGERPPASFFFENHPTRESHAIIASAIEDRIRALDVSIEAKTRATK